MKANYESSKTLLRLCATGIAALGLFMLAGCVSTDAALTRINAFSEATTLAAGNTKTAYDTAERKYYDVQVLRSVVSYDTAGFRPDKFQTLFSADSRQARESVLDALALYGQKLAVMMGNEQLDEFDEATKKFGEGLGQVNSSIGTTKTFSGERVLEANELRAVTTAVSALGKWFIRIKREKGVRAAVREMDPHVEAITAALAKDLQALRRIVRNQYTQLQISEDKYIRDSRFEPQAKRQAIGALAHLVIEAREADATYAAMERSITALRQAHGRLLDVFTDNKVEIDARIRELAAEAQRVKKFYDSLEKK